jgi:hypothetical protein
MNTTTPQTAKENSALGFAMLFVIQVMTKGNAQWRNVSEKIKSLNVAIVTADSKLSRKLPARIAVRVIDEAGRVRFKRVKKGHEDTVRLRELRQDILQSILARY